MNAVSKTVQVRCHETLHLVERFEIFKDSIFEYCVKLMLDARENCCLFELVEPALIEVSVPVELPEIYQLVPVQHLAHTGLYFCFVKIRIVLPWLFTRQLDVRWLKVSVTAFKSGKRQVGLRLTFLGVLIERKDAWSVDFSSSFYKLIINYKLNQSSLPGRNVEFL